MFDRFLSGLVGTAIVCGAATASVSSLGEHDHSHHLHRPDLVVPANVPVSPAHSALVRFGNFASLSDAGGVEWTTLYEVFPSDESGLAGAAMQSLANADSASIVKGELRALVVNIATPTRTAAPRGLVAEAYSQATTRISLMSRNMATVLVEHFGRDVLVPDVADVCKDYGTLSAAANAIIAAELSLDGYRSVDYVIPYLSNDNCDWAGKGGGKKSWNFSFNGQPPRYGTIVHEWGHQYSLPHLRAIRCTKDGQNVPLVDRAGREAGQCVMKEYGGAFSVMGPSWANNSAAMTFGERAQLGWLRDGEEKHVHDGEFTLGFDGPLSLLWLLNSEGDLFQIEFVKAFTHGESPWGFTDPFSGNWHYFDKTPNYSHQGVMIKYVSKVSVSPSNPMGYSMEGYVLDATPETILSTDAAFRAGTSFVDPTGSLTVEVLSVNDQSAQVRVRGIPHKPWLVQSVQAVATETLGVFDVSFTPTQSDPPVTHYEIQISDNWEFTNPQTFTVLTSPGRVTIPNYDKSWTQYRVAAVSSAGRGDFSGSKQLIWSATAKSQVQAVATETLGVFDVSFTPIQSDPPVTHYEIQISDNWEFTNPQTFTVLTSPGRVTIPNYDKSWTQYRVAAVSSAGRGDFSGSKQLIWSATAKSQVQAVATETLGVFDVSFTPTQSDPPVTHYEIQISDNWEFTNPQTFTVLTSPGRVTIPNYDKSWTQYRVAAVSSAGRGDFSGSKQLIWSATAKPQPLTAKPQPLTAKPQPLTAKPQPFVWSSRAITVGTKLKLSTMVLVNVKGNRADRATGVCSLSKGVLSFKRVGKCRVSVSVKLQNSTNVLRSSKVFTINKKKILFP